MDFPLFITLSIKIIRFKVSKKFTISQISFVASKEFSQDSNFKWYKKNENQKENGLVFLSKREVENVIRCNRFIDCFRLLYSGNIYKPYKIWRIVEQNLDVRSPHGEQISFIEAYDSHPSASDAGYASIVGGGVGARQVTIHLESARGHGLKYYVRVFGHY